MASTIVGMLAELFALTDDDLEDLTLHAAGKSPAQSVADDDWVPRR
jgi:hypothetical protein